MRLIWLDEDISPIDTPDGVVIKLFGIYNDNNKYTTIYLIIDYKGTEYKITRYHKYTTNGSDIERLKHRYSRTIQNFTRKYRHGPFTELIDKFLSWSDNSAHNILKELIADTARIDI